MKKLFRFALSSLAVTILFVACQKAAPIDEPAASAETVTPAKKQVTVLVSIPQDGLETKVALEQDGSNKKLIKLSWEDDDKITINGETFTIVPASIADEGHSAQFTGADPGAGPYTISYSNLPGSFNAQTQAADGDTDHLGYSVSLSGADTYEDLSFSSTWASAHSATLAQSSVLHLRAQLPDGALWLSSVKKVIFKSSANVFNGSNKLTVTLTTAGTGGDRLLDVYATLPAGSAISVPDLMVQFQVSANEYDIYTSYRAFSPDKAFPDGAAHYLGIDCSNIASFANASITNIGEFTNPYLIGDPHQLAALSGLMAGKSTGTTVYAELIDNIDLTGYANWSPIDASTRYINFEGNNHKISKLTITSGTYCGLFSILYGTVQNLVIENADISGVSKASGILTGYICSNTGSSIGCTIDHVTISGTNSLNGGAQYCGALGGVIGKHATNTFAVSISDIEISGLTVTSSQSSGGLIGYTQYETCTNRSLTIDGVNIINSSVATTGAGKCVGGLIGILDDPSADIDNIDIKGTNVSGLTKALGVGGIIGQVTAAADIDGCTYENNAPATATVTGPTQHNGDASTAGAYIGGIVGEVSGAASFDDCHVKNATVTFTTPGSNTSYWKYTGGAFGYIHNASATVGASTACTLVSTTVTAHHYSGGFIGFLDGGSISNCTITNLSYSGYNYSGGFVGQIDAGSISSCTVAGNTVQSVNATVGGFAGMINGGSLEGCSTSLQMGDADHKTGGNAGGFVGRVIADVYIYDCHSSGHVFSSGGTVGGFAGEILDGDFESCSSLGNVTASGYMGGFVGVSQTNAASFTDCTVGDGSHNPSITQTAADGNYFTGGFIGNCQIGSSFDNCDVKAQITMPTNAIKGVGGFVGHTVTGRPSFTDCDVVAGSVVNAKANWVGGFAGYTQIGGTFNTCTSAANVNANATGVQYVGGFVGFADGTDASDKFKDCGATGTVYGYQHVGGFVGIANGETFDGCYYTGTSVSSNFSGKSAFLGGFCGDTPSGKANVFKSCYVGDGINTVTVSSTSGQRVGGFIGQNYNAIGNNCYVIKTAVSGSTNTGGFVGVQYANIEKCWVEEGSVTSNGGGNTGGFSAFMQGCTLDDCYSTANVNGSSYNTVGGLVGVTNSGISINRCYASGAVNGTGSNRGGLIGSLVSGATADKCISWNSSLPLAGNDAGTNTNNYVKSGSETGTISSHAKESPRSWSSETWNWNDTGADPLNRPTLK